MNIDFNEFSKLVSQWLTEHVVSKLDALTIQKILLFGIGKLKELAASTKNQIDDWAIGELENYIQDLGKIEQIRAFVVEKIGMINSGECGATDEEFNTLADSLVECHDGCCGTPAGNRVIARLLSYLIMSIIEYFTKKD